MFLTLLAQQQKEANYLTRRSLHKESPPPPRIRRALNNTTYFSHIITFQKLPSYDYVDSENILPIIYSINSRDNCTIVTTPISQALA